MMKLSMLSLVPVVAAYRKKCDIVGSGRAQCKDPTDSAYSFEQSDAITACNATAACELVCTCFVTANGGQSWEYVPTPRETCNMKALGQAKCLSYTDYPDSYTSDELKALEDCEELNYCTWSKCSQDNCFVAPADEKGSEDGKIWLYTPRTQKCNLQGASMAQCRPYDSGDTKDFYVSSQIDALKFNEINPCGDPTCTCFVTDETDEQEAGQSWIFTPKWRAGCEAELKKGECDPGNPIPGFEKDCDDDQCCELSCEEADSTEKIYQYWSVANTDPCCKHLTDVSTDPSAVYYVDMDLKGSDRSHDHLGQHVCGDEVLALHDLLRESKDGQNGLMAGWRRLGTNNRVGTTSNDGGASDLAVCSTAEATSWVGCNAVTLCATYNAYKEENDGLAECYEPVKGHVVSGGKVTTVDRMQWWQNPV